MFQNSEYTKLYQTTLEMYGIFFKNFDNVVYEIIEFEVRRKNNYLALTKKISKLGLLLETGGFFTIHGFSNSCILYHVN